MERYVVHITKECNMACRYCYEEDKTSGDCSWEDTKKLLDQFNFNEKFEVEFLGGEPLLNFKLIKQCVDYLNHRALVRAYYITTNGTILNDEIIEFLKQNSNIHIGVSMDGNRFMNSLRVFKDGKNSFDIVMQNLYKYKEAIEDDRLFIHMVLHPYNVGYFSAGVDFLYKKGFKNIDPGIVEKTMNLTDEYIKVFIREHNIISQKIIDGEYPGLIVTTLSYPPSFGDKRTYILNKEGVVVGETYGRSKLYIDDSYTIRQSSNHSNIIKMLREKVYNNHINKLKGGINE